MRIFRTTSRTRISIVAAVVLGGGCGGSVGLPDAALPDLAMCPQPVDDWIVVPVRFCVVAGSQEAEGVAAAGVVAAPRLHQMLRDANDRILGKSAHICLHSLAAQGEVPVIAVTPPPNHPNGVVDGTQIKHVKDSCDRAWQNRHGTTDGLAITNAQELFGIANAFGATPQPDEPLRPGKPRNADLCTQPRNNLRTSDVTPMHNVILDLRSGFYGSYDVAVRTLAHEAGHAFTLGHGNGLDDGSNGVTPAGTGLDRNDNPGLRRYDQFCDPGEDEAIPPLTLMHPQAGAQTDSLRPLQIEHARGAAKVFDGARAGLADPAGQLLREGSCVPSTCSVPPDLLIERVEVAETPGVGTSDLALWVEGPIGTTVHNRYLAFVDLDNDPSTGCAAASLGLPTEMSGVELATSVLLAPEEAPAASVWTCGSGGWQATSDPGVSAQVSNPSTDGDDFSRVTLHLPNAVRGPAGPVVRVQGVVESLASGTSWLDRVPAAPGQGGEVNLIPAWIPSCCATPLEPQVGAPLTVSMGGLPASGEATIALGELELGAFPVDSSGTLFATFAVPSTILPGLHAITVSAPGVRSGLCGVRVVGGVAP